MMKLKIIVALLFVGITSYAQTNEDVEPISLKNEFTTNLLDLVIAGSVNINYESLWKNNQSLYLGATFFDTYGYYDAGYLEESNAFSLRAAYLIYFSKRKDHYGFYFYPMLKLRTGEVTVDDGYSGFNSTETSYSYGVGGFSAGFGLGHKWLFSDRFSLSLTGEIARELGDVPEDPFGDLGVVEPRFGVNFGYRF